MGIDDDQGVKKQTLRERNLELHQIETTLALKTRIRVYSVLTIFLLAGFLALVALLVVVGVSTKDDDERILKRESSKTTMQLIELERIMNALEEQMTIAHQDLDEREKNSCERKKTSDFMRGNHLVDERGYDANGCRGTELKFWQDCALLCDREGVTDCQKEAIANAKNVSVADLTESDTKCRVWLYDSNTAFIKKKWTFSGVATDEYANYLHRTKMCYTYPDFSALPKLRAFDTVTDIDYVMSGMHNCRQGKLLESWISLYQTMDRTGVIAPTTKIATAMKSYVEGACPKQRHLYGYRLQEDLQDEYLLPGHFAGGYFQTVPTKPYSDTRAVWCREFCEGKKPFCMWRWSFSLGCHINTLNAPNPIDCQVLCEEDPDCMAWLSNREGHDVFGAGDRYGWTTKTRHCQLYKTAHYQQDAVEAMQLYNKAGGSWGTSSWSHAFNMAGMRGCETTDLEKRTYIEVPHTKEVWFRCGTVLEGLMLETDHEHNKKIITDIDDVKKCSMACTDEEYSHKDFWVCQSWSYVADTKECHLFVNATATIQDSGSVSGARNCDAHCDRHVTYKESSDEETSTTTTPKECLDKCKDSLNCKMFVWKGSTEQCRLLSTETLRSPADKTDKVTSGPWHCQIQPPALCPEYKIRIRCEHIHKFRNHSGTTWQVCAGQCKAHPDCKYWSMFRTSYCYLFDNDRDRGRSSSYTSGSVACQHDTEVGEDQTDHEDYAPYNRYTVHLRKPYKVPFRCLHSGLRLTPTTRGRSWYYGGTKVYRWPECIEMCKRKNATIFTGYEYAANGWPAHPIRMKRGEVVFSCVCLSQDEYVAGVSGPGCSYHYKFGDPNCTLPATEKALQHYPEYHASFIGWGCHSRRCILGEMNDDHTIYFVYSVESCIKQCFDYGKITPVYVLTYAPGYHTCYCHRGGGENNYYQGGPMYYPANLAQPEYAQFLSYAFS